MKKQKDGRDKAEGKGAKPKKEKIVYIDDNSTIVDMSGTRPGGAAPKKNSTLKEKLRTYFSVVKKMLLPMFITLLAFTLVYVFLLAISGKLF